MKYANGDEYKGCFSFGSILGEGKFIIAEAKVTFQGRFGLERSEVYSQEEAVEEKLVLSAHSGLSSAVGLVPVRGGSPLL